MFEGTVIRRRGEGGRASFTVRRISYGVGVERTFPLHSPRIERVEVVRRGRCAARSSTTCANWPARRPA